MCIWTTLILACSIAGIPQAEAQTVTDARQLFEDGNAHLELAMRSRGEARVRALRDALNLYHRSLRVTRARSVLFNIAFCYENLERYQDAFAYYSEYLDVEDLSAEDRATAEERLAAMAPNVALVQVVTTPPGATVYLNRRDLAPQGVSPITVATQPGSHRVIIVLDGYETGEAEVETTLGDTREVVMELIARPTTIHIETDPPGAEIRLDEENGEIQGVTPLTTTIDAGPHRIYATLRDRSGRTVIEAPPGGELNVTVELAAPTTPGNIAIHVDAPGAEITIDGVELGQAPVSQLRLTPGIHRISVSAGNDFNSWSDVIEIGPGHELALEVHLAPTIPERRFGPWPNVSMVFAIALGLAAAATGGWALALNSDFEDVRRSCEAIPQDCGEGSVLRDEAFDLERSIRRLAVATDVLIGLTSAIAITSFALMLLNREIEDTSRVNIAFAPTRGGAVASLGIGAMLRRAP